MKLQRQFSKYGASLQGMPPLEVKRGNDGQLIIFDGVTRASRAAKFAPGALVTVEATGNLNGPVGGLPTVGEKI